MEKKELLDIKKIILDGNKEPEEYEIPFFKEIHGKEVSVRIRGLSNYEYDIISLEMYNEIDDIKTVRYIFNPEIDEKLKGLKGEERDKREEELQAEYGVNPVEISKAYVYRNVLITYYAMKDYYEDLTINQVKQLDGLREIAKRVNEKSGRTPEIIKKINFFREQQRKQ